MFEQIFLFLAFPLTSSYEEALATIPFAFREEMIRTHLQMIEKEEGCYLAKLLGPSTDVETVNLAAVHLYSVLKKLTPDYPCEQHPLRLITHGT